MDGASAARLAREPGQPAPSVGAEMPGSY